MQLSVTERKYLSMIVSVCVQLLRHIATLINITFRRTPCFWFGLPLLGEGYVIFKFVDRS